MDGILYVYCYTAVRILLYGRTYTAIRPYVYCYTAVKAAHLTESIIYIPYLCMECSAVILHEK